MAEPTDTASYRRAIRIVKLAALGVLVIVLRPVAFFPLLWMRMLVLPITSFCPMTSLAVPCIAAVIYPDSTLMVRRFQLRGVSGEMAL